MAMRSGGTWVREGTQAARHEENRGERGRGNREGRGGRDRGTLADERDGGQRELDFRGLARQARRCLRIPADLDNSSRMNSSRIHQGFISLELAIITAGDSLESH